MRKTGTAHLLALALAAAGACTSPGAPSDGAQRDLRAADLLRVDLAISIPPLPVLGAQIDRVGRPLVNLGLTNPFQIVPGEINLEISQTNYNHDSQDPQWVATYGDPFFALNLAIYDGVDTVCGNQVLASMSTPNATRYNPLGELLADDRLYVDLSQQTCQKYLSVELKSQGVEPAGADCGGRTPLYDVATATYSLLIAGTRTGVSDGIPQKTVGQPSQSDFPFLAKPLW